MIHSEITLPVTNIDQVKSKFNTTQILIRKTEHAFFVRRIFLEDSNTHEYFTIQTIKVVSSEVCEALVRDSTPDEIESFEQALKKAIEHRPDDFYMAMSIKNLDENSIRIVEIKEPEFKDNIIRNGSFYLPFSEHGEKICESYLDANSQCQISLFDLQHEHAALTLHLHSKGDN